MADKQPKIFAVIMAAGGASRFGSTKQLAEADGTPLIRRATSAAHKAFGSRVLTVIGHDRCAVLEALGSDAGFVVVNDDYESGLSTSIAAGVDACRDDADAVLLMLADQPLVTAGHLHSLVEAWSGRSDEIVATAYGDTQGAPVLFPTDAFDDLVVLKGDRGARSLLHDRRFSLRRVRFEAAAVDIDTPADLAALGEEPLHPGDDL